MSQQPINRAPRDSENRENTSRPKQWVPPTAMPEPEPRPGWTHRWIRTSTLSASDNTNVSSKFRQGWEPAPAKEYPEITVLKDRNSQFPEHIEVGGLLLCRMPDEVVQQRRAYYQDLAESQIAAVENNLLRESDPRMPLSKPQMRQEVTFGGGRKR